MAAKIKGITIEIGGDTQKLNKALEDVNKKTRDVQSELRQVERLLKLDPSNTTLLAQKQELLSKAISNTKEKLETLKEAERQVQQQFERGEIGEEQYRAIQREVIETEQELKKLENQLRETNNKWKETAETLDRFGKKSTEIGKDLSMKVTAPIVATGAASFKMAADLEDAFGATDQIFKNAANSVKKWADELESYYGIAEGEALEYANMMGALLQNIGGLTEEEAAKQAQTLVQLAGDLAAMFGGTPADAVRALTGALKGNTSMLDNYGIACNDALIKTKALEMGIWDGTGQMDLATKQAAILALIMEQTGAAQGQAAREAEGASGSMRALVTEIKNLSTDIGEVLLPVITPFIQRLRDIIGAFGELSPGAQKVIIALAGIAAAIGPLLLIVGQISLGLSSLIGLFGGTAAAAAGTAAAATGATAAVGGLGAVITTLTGPVGIAIAAIAALTAGGIALYKHMQKDSIPTVNLFGDTVSEATQQAVGSFMELNEQATLALNQLSWSGQEVTQEMADSITNNFSQMAEQVQAGLDSHYQESLQKMQAFVNNSASLSEEEQEQILANMQQGYENRKQTIEEGEARIKEILQTASEEKRALTKEEQEEINAIQQEMVNTGIQVLSENELEAKAIMERMRQQAGEISARQAAEVVQNSLYQKDEAIKAAEEQYNEVIKEIIRQRDEAGTITAEQADKLIQEAKRQRDEAIAKATEMHNQVVEQAKLQAGEHVNQVDWETGEIKSKWEVMRDEIVKKSKEIKEDIIDKWESIKKTAEEKWGKVKETVSDTIENMKSKISEGIEKIKEWNNTSVKEKVFSIVEKVTRVFSDVGNAVSSAIGRNAQGTNFWRGGLTWVGEQGPELVNLPKGSRIYSNKKSIDLIKSALSDITVKIDGQIPKGDTIIHVYNPQPSPAELARQIKKSQQQLALGF